VVHKVLAAAARLPDDGARYERLKEVGGAAACGNPSLGRLSEPGPFCGLARLPENSLPGVFGNACPWLIRSLQVILGPDETLEDRMMQFQVIWAGLQ
jgi:hypothetical protein